MGIPPSADIRPIALENLIIDDDIRTRVAWNLDAIETYAQLYKDGEIPLPPIDVFALEGGRYFVADGFHRLKAALKTGLAELVCQVHQGTPRDAMLFAVEANACHGLQYTSGDKALILRRVLADAELGGLADRAIAKRFSMSHTYVARIRREVDLARAFDEDLAMVVATVAGSPDPEHVALARMFGEQPTRLRI